MGSPHREIDTSSTEEQQNGNEDFTARSYQLELFEKAKEQNSILVLGTGSGKTFISILLIKEYADQIRGGLADGKRTVFVVNTVPLVYQQAQAIKRHTALTVGVYEGSMGVDFWTDEKWQEELEKNEVLVMVAKIFLDLVLHARLPLSRVNLLIVDECHHTSGSHPMREIMREYEELKGFDPEECPKVLGLTACVIHKRCKKEKVLPAMKKLEAAMNCALVTSTDVVQVTRYSTAPEEKIVAFECEELSEYQKVILNQLMGIVYEVEELTDIDDRSKKLVMKRIKNITFIMKELGDWCVARAIKYEMEDLENPDEADPPLVKELLHTVRSRLEQIRTSCLETEEKMQNPIHHISKKLRKLLDILQACPENVYGLIFVERRNTAKIIYDFLLAVANTSFEFSFIKPLYTVGCNTRPGGDINLASLEQRKQSQTLEKFRKGEINFIVSTSVLEEGVDIRKCNIVIRYDLPCNYRSYVQSRGRARAIPSRYVLVVKETDVYDLLNDVSVYREIELVLSQLCHGRQLPSSSDTRSHFAEDQYIPPFQPFGPSGPKVTINSAVGLINVYCGQLPHDKFTELTPEVKYKHLDEKTVQAGIRLPINAPLKEMIFGEKMENKDLAKKSAALCLCIRLFKMGELNKYLRPRDEKKDDRLLDGIVDLPYEHTEQGPQPGTRKRKQVYTKEVCEAFVPAQESQYLLYILEIEPQCTSASDIMIDSNKCDTSVALLCENELVHCPFPLYFRKWGEVKVRVKPLGKLTSISPKLVDKIKHFHSLVFQQMLHINPSIFEYGCRSPGVLIAPVTKSGNIDGNLLQNLESLTTLTPLVEHNASSGLFHFEKSVYEDSIIYPVYDPKASLFYVSEICYDQSPASQFSQSKKEYATFEDFYFLRHNMKITNKQQPLIAAKHMVKEFNYLKKQDTAKKQKSEKYVSEAPRFVPELCCVMPLKASLWWQLTCVPSILHRLSSVGLSHQLSLSLNPAYCQTEGVRSVPIDFDWSVINAGTASRNLEGNLAVTLVSKKGKQIHPAMLLHALTLRQANDNFDLERMEILGDSFLKYVIAEYLFLNFPNEHEGQLSQNRVSLVSNKTLYLLGKKKKIPEKVVSQNLRPQWNGFLPGFTIKSDVEEQLKNIDFPHDRWPELPDFGHISELKDVAEVKYDENGKRIGGLCYNPWTEHEVADKSVADCVEALIGAYLLACGSKAAVSFLHNLGVGVTAEKSLLKTELSVPTALVNMEHWAWGEVQRLYKKACLDRLEEKIKYTFKDKSFIVQAVTHSSFNQNVTDCYQRLEFLGDAVLDFLVTCLVFSRHSEYSPGQVTDLRSHYVRNETLAIVCVKNGLEKHLLHMADRLQAAIDRFLNKVIDESSMEDVNIEEDEVESQDIDVPKALGDMVEAIIGAVYLDSGRSLQATWNVVVVLMGHVIQETMTDIPIDCVRKLYEEMANKVKFTKVLRMEDDDVARYKVEVEGLPVLVGKGKNYRTAKIAAAKLALQKLRDARNC